MFYGNTKTEKLRNDLHVVTICLAKLWVYRRPRANMFFCFNVAFISKVRKNCILYSKIDPAYAQCYCLFINLCLLVLQHVSANSYAIIGGRGGGGGIITNCIRCALNYKAVKQLKMLKTSLQYAYRCEYNKYIYNERRPHNLFFTY
jgi:hypothetical protein